MKEKLKAFLNEQVEAVVNDIFEKGGEDEIGIVDLVIKAYYDKEGPHPVFIRTWYKELIPSVNGDWHIEEESEDVCTG